MKLSFWGSAGAVGMATLVLTVAIPAYAANYSFTNKGIVDVSVNKKTVNVTGTQASNDEAKADTLDKNVPYSISKAKVFKYNGTKLMKSSASAIRFGDEVVLKGKKVGDTFVVSTLTINDRRFEITGTVSDVDKSNNQIKVTVKTSNYKQKNIKGTDITVKYSSKTVCKEGGTEIGCSEIDSDGQKIKVSGGVTGTDNVYEVLKVWNKY